MTSIGGKAGAESASREKNATKTTKASSLASPYHVLAASETIPGCALPPLARSGVGLTLISSGLFSEAGVAWGELVGDDVSRLASEAPERWSTAAVTQMQKKRALWE